MRRRDRVEIAGEMEVDRLHRNDLGIAAAGRAAFDAETGAKRGLAQRDDGLLADGSRSASARPTEVVVLPSPAGVGLMAVTRMSLLLGRALARSCAPLRKCRSTLPIFCHRAGSLRPGFQHARRSSGSVRAWRHVRSRYRSAWNDSSWFGAPARRLVQVKGCQPPWRGPAAAAEKGQGLAFPPGPSGSIFCGRSSESHVEPCAGS